MDEKLYLVIVVLLRIQRTYKTMLQRHPRCLCWTVCTHHFLDSSQLFPLRHTVSFLSQENTLCFT